VFLDSFGRRAFRHGGKVIKCGEPVDIPEAQVLAFVENSALSISVPEVYSSSRCGNVE